jgi:hypothetical protein
MEVTRPSGTSAKQPTAKRRENLKQRGRLSQLLVRVTAMSLQNNCSARQIMATRTLTADKLWYNHPQQCLHFTSSRFPIARSALTSLNMTAIFVCAHSCHIHTTVTNTPMYITVRQCPWYKRPSQNGKARPQVAGGGTASRYAV